MLIGSHFPRRLAPARLSRQPVMRCDSDRRPACNPPQALEFRRIRTGCGNIPCFRFAYMLLPPWLLIVFTPLLGASCWSPALS